MAPAEIAIEVAYALPERQEIYALVVPSQTTAGQAIARSGLLTRYPDLDLSHIGLFGCPIDLDHILSEGDRIEIYRPLALDPKLARQQKVKLERKRLAKWRQKKMN